jgi:thymidylate synthase (FAD)
MLSDLGHASPIEHASFTFGIEGVSRTLLAQITRHRLASFSVQSQRYVRLDDFRYVVPPEIEAIPEAKAAFIDSMNEDAKRYLDLAKKLEDGHTARLMAEGMPEKAARSKAAKQANEDARFVLPNACETKMVVTMNTRSLLNFFRLRCCNRAQWEIRALAEEMLRLVYPVAPHLFRTAGPGCLTGACPEGKMCCGKTAEVRAKYEAMHAQGAEQ